MKTVVQLNVPDANVWRSVAWAGALIGFALGGFFDGILLHQILQWHHLLSALNEAPFADAATQILADGLFHALMYLLALAGLWKLFRARHALCETPVDRLVIAHAAIGFGVWHIVDALVSHWLLGIHRIRMDVANPLFWDVLWLIAFGALPLLVGLVLQGRAWRSERRGSNASATNKLYAVMGVTIASALFAASAGDARGRVAVVIRPDVAPMEILKAASALDARLLWASPRGDAWVFAMQDKSPLSFYQHGALYVSGSLGGVDCAALTI